MTKICKAVNDLAAFEREILPPDCNIVAGLDEAGRGPLAGPVIAAAVILPQDDLIDGIYDSKALTPAQREMAFEEIVSRSVDIGIGLADHTLIDEINILQATVRAMRAAISNLLVRPDCVLIDAVNIPGMDDIHQRPVIKGDQKSYSIAAASIVAKVVRDRLMNRLHLRYPVYNFARNKGYGTKDHIEALARFGPCPLHRLTFNKVKEFCQEGDTL
ncbi:ribonuclease HII [bacterium]|nr:ribonuclease HII [bacterium]